MQAGKRWIPGIFANSTENGSSTIDVKGSILVLPDSGQTGYGIYTDNTGGNITVSVGDDVTADGADSIGAVVINDADNGFNDTEDENGSKTTTTIEINGDLSGKSTGLYVEGSGSSLADIFVEGTILGDDAGVEISDEVTPENLDLKVWRITSQNGKTVTGAHSKDVGNSIKYLIKFAANCWIPPININMRRMARRFISDPLMEISMPSITGKIKRLYSKRKKTAVFRW